MIVAEKEVWNCCYVLPDPPGHPIRIVVPSALQMGWAESPPYFSAATETGRDIIQGLVADQVELPPPHCFEQYMHPTKAAKRSRSDSPAHGIFVYVDDFIGAAVEDKSGTLLGRITRAALHGIQSVFPSPEITGHIGGKDPISVKKLERGDARWHHEKEILGFLVDGAAKTVRISEAKATDIGTEPADPQREARPAQTIPKNCRQASACGTHPPGHPWIIFPHQQSPQRRTTRHRTRKNERCPGRVP
jgi:hypothetical protein